MLLKKIECDFVSWRIPVFLRSVFVVAAVLTGLVRDYLKRVGFVSF